MMKRFLILFAAAAVLFASCQKEASLPTVEFGQTFYTLYAQGQADISVTLSKAPSAEIKVPLVVSGDAVKNTDFTLSSDYAVFAAGQKETVITVKDQGLTPEKSVTLTLGAGKDYSLGVKYVTIVSLDAGEKLIYNFSTSGATLYEKVTATLHVESVSAGKNYRAPEDLHIPIKISGNDANYVRPAANEFVVAKGTATATLEFTPAADIPSDLPNDIKVKVTIDGERFLPGDRDSFTIKVESGIQVPARLVGKWVFDHIYDQEEIELWFEEGEEDITLLPFKNDGFTLEFVEDENGIVTLIPGASGDYAAYFTETTPIILTTPKNYSAEGVVLGKYTVSEINMFEAEETDEESQVWTYYLIDANRAFSKSKRTVGNSVIAFRLTPEGGLDMQFRDYDTPPFGTVYWWDPTSFDADMFGFATLFTRVAE